ncbi:MAG: hypothetical protein IIV18_04040 [Lachnospiraceae bacterium]|nr:hypothetical protein [Lachnospiraceae bacterium]
MQAFTAQETLTEYTSRHPVDLLLASADFLETMPEQENVRQIMMLTEEAEYSGPMASAYKYQSADALVQEILRHCTEKSPNPEMRWRKNTEFYGVYSPIKRCGKTGFAVMLGQALAEHGRVLYLNFEEYPGFGELFGKKDCDFSEVLLYLRQGRERVYQRIQKNICALGRIDYVPPGVGYGDICQMEWKHWQCLLESIREEEVYDSVVLDLGSVQGPLFKVFGYCKEIFMPVLDDPVSKAKVEEFRWICSGLEEADTFGRIRTVYPPQENYWEQLNGAALEESGLYRYAISVLGD